MQNVFESTLLTSFWYKYPDSESSPYPHLTEITVIPHLGFHRRRCHIISIHSGENGIIVCRCLIGMPGHGQRGIFSKPFLLIHGIDQVEQVVAIKTLPLLFVLPGTPLADTVIPTNQLLRRNMSSNSRQYIHYQLGKTGIIFHI